jgi:hypothetical protein
MGFIGFTPFGFRRSFGSRSCSGSDSDCIDSENGDLGYLKKSGIFCHSIRRSSLIEALFGRFDRNAEALSMLGAFQARVKSCHCQ